ncbi:MAG: MFS transporter [Trueperaceae bacterium]
MNTPLATLDPTVRRTMRFSTIEGSFVQAFLNWTTGSALIGYMLYLGASAYEISLVGSVPLLAQITNPFAAYFAGLLGRRKYLAMVFSGLGRGLWLFAAFLPQLGLPESIRPASLVLLVLVSSIFQSAAGTLWTAWMADVVPQNVRGRYFGIRAGVVGVVGMVANLAAGWFLDAVREPLNFQIIMGLAVLSATVGVVCYIFHYEPPVTGKQLGFRATFIEPLRHANFRKFLRFAIYWQFAVMLAGPLVMAYFLDEVKLGFRNVAYWNVITGMAGLITMPLWGRVADRVGNKAVIAIGTVLAGTAMPIAWILLGLTGNIWFFWLSAMFDAMAWGAIGPAVFNLALASSPQTGRAAFISIFGLLTGASGFVGGLLSAPLLNVLSGLEFMVAGLSWTAFHWLFVLSGTARTMAWIFLRPVEEENSWRTRDVLRGLKINWRRLMFPWRL